MLTRLQRYACDYVRWILYITLHTTNLKAGCQMHFIAHSQVHSRACSQGLFQLHSMAHSQPAWLYAPKYTPGHAFKNAPNCTRRHTPSQLDCMLPSKLSRRSHAHSRACSQLPIALDDTLQACLPIHSQGGSQDTPKYTPSTFSSTLPGMLSKTLLIALDDTLPACLTVCSQVSSQDNLKHTLEHTLKYTPNCTRWHTPSLLDYTLPSQLTRCSQAHSEYILKYTPGHALKDAPNCTRWHTFSLLGSTLKSTLSRGKTHPISFDYVLPCMLPGARSRHLLSCRSQAPGGGWPVADGAWRIVAEIMTSVDIIVWTLSSAHPPWQDLTIPHGHGVESCSLRLHRKGRQFELGESRAPTQIFQRNLLPNSHRLWASVCTFSLRLMEIMVVAMEITMAMEMMVVAMEMTMAMEMVLGWWSYTRSTEESRLATSTSASKLPQT